jgi:hypothetical protein
MPWMFQGHRALTWRALCCVVILDADRYCTMQVLYMPDIMRLVTAAEDPAVSLWSIHRFKCVAATLDCRRKHCI